MRRNWGRSIGSGTVPHLRVVYKDIDILEEIASIPTQDPATRLTLKALGEDLVEVEGLYSDDLIQDQELEEELILIPWDDIEDEE